MSQQRSPLMVVKTTSHHRLRPHSKYPSLPHRLEKKKKKKKKKPSHTSLILHGAARWLLAPGASKKASSLPSPPRNFSPDTRSHISHRHKCCPKKLNIMFAFLLVSSASPDLVHQSSWYVCYKQMQRTWYRESPQRGREGKEGKGEEKMAKRNNRLRERREEGTSGIK